MAPALGGRAPRARPVLENQVHYAIGGWREPVVIPLMPGPPVPGWSDPLGRALPIGAPRPPPASPGPTSPTAAAASAAAAAAAPAPADAAPPSPTTTTTTPSRALLRRDRWRVAVSPATDAEGWVYGTQFGHLQYDRPGGRASKRAGDRVRSRLWVPRGRRHRRRSSGGTEDDEADDEETVAAATVDAAVEAVVMGGRAAGAAGEGEEAAATPAATPPATAAAAAASAAATTATAAASVIGAVPGGVTGTAPASLAAIWGMASKLVSDAAARHRGAHNVIALDPSGWLFVLGDHAGLMRRLQLAQLRRLVWFSDDAALTRAMRPATSAEAEAAGVLLRQAPSSSADPSAAAPSSSSSTPVVALPGAPTLSVVLELGPSSSAPAPPPAPDPTTPTTTPTDNNPGGQLQLRVCPRAHLEELLAAARYSLAAYGFVASAGHLSSVAAALRLMASLPTFDAVDGASREANMRALLSIARLGSGPQAERDVVHAEWRAAPFRPAHYVALDRRRRCVVLCVRGSLGLGDAMTDLAAAPRPFEFRGVRGHVHEGLLAAAAYVQARCADALARAAAMAAEAEEAAGASGDADDTAPTKKKWDLFVCGHSLGGGVAALVTLLLQQPQPQTSPSPSSSSLFASVRCVCVGPAAVLSAPLSDCVRPHVTSVVLGTDPVPRLSQYSVERLLLDLVAGSLSRRALSQVAGAAASTQASVAALASRLQRLAAGGSSPQQQQQPGEGVPALGSASFSGTGGLRDFLMPGGAQRSAAAGKATAAKEEDDNAETTVLSRQASEIQRQQEEEERQRRSMEEDEFIKLLDWGGLRNTFVRSWFGEGSQGGGGGGGNGSAAAPSPSAAAAPPPSNSSPIITMPPPSAPRSTATTPTLAKPGRVVLAPSVSDGAANAEAAAASAVASASASAAAAATSERERALAEGVRAAVEGLGSPSRCPPPLAPPALASAAAPPPAAAADSGGEATAASSPRVAGAGPGSASPSPRGGNGNGGNGNGQQQDRASIVHSLEEDLAHVVHLYPPGRVLWLLSDDLVGGAAQQLARAVEAHLPPAPPPAPTTGMATTTATATAAVAAAAAPSPSAPAAPAAAKAPPPPAVLEPPRIDDGMTISGGGGAPPPPPTTEEGKAAAANRLRASAADAARGVLSEAARDPADVPPAARSAAREALREAAASSSRPKREAGDGDGASSSSSSDDDDDDDARLLPPHVRELLDLLGPPVDAPSAMAIAHKRALLLDHVRRTRCAGGGQAAGGSAGAGPSLFGVPLLRPPFAAASAATSAQVPQESALARAVRERLEALRDGLAAALPPSVVAGVGEAGVAACVPPALGGGGGASGGGAKGAAGAADPAAAAVVIVEPARDAFDRLVLHRNALDDHVPDAYMAAIRRLAAAYGIVDED